MRIYGAAPFGQDTIPIGLQGGQIYYPAPGNYLCQLGSQSVLQFFDSNTLLWRNVAFPGSFLGMISTDGSNYRIINMSGVVSGVQITNPGSGGTANGIGSVATGVSIGFGGAPANGVAASAYPIVGGKLSGLTIAAGGSGFVMPPALFIDPPPNGGIQATASCTISAGAINAVTLQNAGAGYASTPSVYIIPQFGTYQGVGQPVNAAAPTSPVPPGAFAGTQPPFLPGVQWLPTPGGANITVNSITGSGQLTGAVMTGYGVGYTGTIIPAVTFAGGGLAGGVAATSIMSFSVTAVGTAGTAGAGYTIGAPWITGLGVLQSPAANTDFCNGVYEPRPARGRIAAATGFTGTAAIIEDAGFGLQTIPHIGILPDTSTIATISTTTLTLGGVYDVSLLSPAIED